ncbi:MAG: hypothetical protein H6983_09915 [Ectothiorhodospiraceae bacterium]|nr:hypothetical protein [Chromatiales bacterium]MCP5154470.1 hypothetical protein [Ectothiorhodospiraceae bacterium]
MADSTSQDDQELLDFSSTVCRFLVLSPKGQLFSLNAFLLSRDMSRIVPRIATANFHPIYPLIAGTRPSRMLLVLHPGERANAYFLMDMQAGGQRKSMKVFQEAQEIVSGALVDGLLPIIHLEELQRNAMLARRNKSPISVRLRYLLLRPNLPSGWLDCATAVFRFNAEVTDDKATLIEDKLAELRREVGRTMIDKYLAKCIWLDSRTGLLGRVSGNAERTGFGSFITGDAHVVTFGRSLARDHEGRYDARTGFANVIPALVKGTTWTSPTLHVYDEKFRDDYGLEEYYSLYRGLAALSEIGAPVLIHSGSALGNAIPVALLRPERNRDLITQISVREFPGREVIWERPGEGGG